MKAPAPGEAATHLPWLSPRASSLLAMARLPPAAAWEAVRSDPGAVLLLLRHGPRAAETGQGVYLAALETPGVLEAAAARLETHGGTVDWRTGPAARVHGAAVAFARVARRLAEITGRCHADNAWVGAMLAPLGWMAVSAADPDASTRCLEDPELAARPGDVQERAWSLDQAAIGRRLARRWGLPAWMAAVLGHLDLPATTACVLGADADLFRLVQLAVLLTQRRVNALALVAGAEAHELAADLGLSRADLEAVEREVAAAAEPAGGATAEVAIPDAILRDFLLLAAENRRLAQAPVTEALERDVDNLRRALAEQRAGERDRVRTLKLSALAEFAAGAGHEINNPLAVISGRAQDLLHHEADPERQRALQKIIDQTRRIHQMLNDLMHFARPPRPSKEPVDVGTLVRDVADSMARLAAERRVRIICPPPEHPTHVFADPRQLRAATLCLLRNAVEAAPPEGWAGVRQDHPAPDRLDLIVEDSGPGPDPAGAQHLFDPFYSGRQAGRGRGLGLSTAWRLMREHGGDVRFEPVPGGPTRFVLTLPLERPTNGHAPVPAGERGCRSGPIPSAPDQPHFPAA